MAVQAIWPDSELAWVADPAPGPSKVLAYRHPDVPNLGDITTVDWAAVAPVDIITGGSPCFVAGTPVLTHRGLIPIEDVIEGDQVWTHEARWRPVTATMTRIAPTVEFRPGFYSTPDHRLWLRKQGRKWNNGRRAYDRVLGDPNWIDAEHSQGHYAATPISVTDVDHNKPETLTWWQIGRFLADGYTSRQVNVYLGGTKLADAEMFPGWKHAQQETALKLTMPKSATEAAWLNRHFGKGAHGKTLPAFVLALREADRRDVLEGYWAGDGHAFAKRSTRSVSVSPTLTVGIQMLAASLGYSTSLHYNRTAPTTVIQGRTVSQRDWWSVTATPDEGRYTERDQDWLWQKLRKEPARGPLQRVYDLTIADDHSFVAAGIVVHNCQDLSTAGKRAGMTDGTRSNLWVQMREAIDALRPRYVVWENVRGALSAHAASDVEPCPGCLGVGDSGPSLRALGRVLGDLADLGYDAQWTGLRVSDLGGCHHRFRVFLLAQPADRERAEQREPAVGGLRGKPWHGAGGDGLTVLRTPTAQLAINGGSQHPDKRRAGGHGPTLADEVEHLLPTPVVSTRRSNRSASPGAAVRPSIHAVGDWLPTPTTEPATGNGHARNLGAEAKPDRWRQYAAAIASHERLVGRPAPDPAEPGKNRPRLSARFTEWMMCLPDGWVTDVPGVTRNEQLALLGNGVVPTQAVAALRHLASLP